MEGWMEKQKEFVDRDLDGAEMEEMRMWKMCEREESKHRDGMWVDFNTMFY